MKEELLVKGIKYYISCQCGEKTFFDKFTRKAICPNCSTENNVSTAVVIKEDNYEDITAYSDLKLTGLKIKTRRN